MRLTEALYEPPSQLLALDASRLRAPRGALRAAPSPGTEERGFERAMFPLRETDRSVAEI